jgi:HPt (histidine-containing phosphotransfer) domain-containing protein
MMKLESTTAELDAALAQTAIDGLVITCGDGGDEAVAGLLGTFFEDVPRLAATLFRGLSEGDAAEVRRAAHTIKSHGATFGVPFLAHVAQELELRGRDGDLAGADALVGELMVEYQRACEVLEAVRIG